MIDQEEIKRFKSRFIIINGVQFGTHRNMSTKMVLGKKVEFQNNENTIIIDIVKGSKILSGDTSDKTTRVREISNDFLQEYITEDIGYILGQDKVKIKEDTIENVYAVGGIWACFTYITSSGNRRLCLNKNIFGNELYLKTEEFLAHKRDFDIESILNEE